MPSMRHANKRGSRRKAKQQPLHGNNKTRGAIEIFANYLANYLLRMFLLVSYILFPIFYTIQHIF